MMESSTDDLEKSSVADSSTTYPYNSAKAETVSGSDQDDLGSRHPKSFSVIYSESASESRLLYSGGSDVEFDTGSLFQNGEKEMLRRYLQDTAHYTDTSGGILTSNQEMFEHFLFSNACDSSPRGDSDMKDNFEAMDEEDLDNYVGHEVGVSRDLTKAMDLDEDFNSSDSFASTESIIPKKIACPKCPKRFMFKSDLKRHDKHKHLRIIDSYFCRYCKKAFSTKEQLKSHEQVHKKRSKMSAKYYCGNCGKAFSNSGNLHYHLKKCPNQQETSK